MELRIVNWRSIFRRRRDREDFSEWAATLASPGAEAMPADTVSTPLVAPGPGTLLLYVSEAADAGVIQVASTGGQVWNNPASTGEKIFTVGLFEEGETITVEHMVGSAFAGTFELGLRHPNGGYNTLVAFTT